MNSKERRKLMRDPLYRESAKATRRHFTSESVRLKQQTHHQKAGTRTSVYTRAGKGRYGEPMVLLRDDGVFKYHVPLLSMTTVRQAVTTAGIPDNRVSKTEKTEALARRQAACRVFKNKQETRTNLEGLRAQIGLRYNAKERSYHV